MDQLDKLDKPYPTRESSFYVVGLQARTSNAAESNPQTAKIPALWQKVYSGELEALVPKRIAKSKPFSVYYDYQSDHSGAYSVVVGYQVRGLGEVPEGLTGLSVSGGRYLMFTAEGELSAVVPQTWGYIWEYFKQPGAPKRAYTYDYEVYESSSKVQIFIAVR